MSKVIKKNCKSFNNKQNGITLIALVITILVLIILAGVVIAFTMGKNGIFIASKNAKKKYQTSEVQEQLEMAIANEQLGNLDKFTLADLKDLKIDNAQVTLGVLYRNAVVKKGSETYNFLIDENLKVTYQENTNFGETGTSAPNESELIQDFDITIEENGTYIKAQVNNIQEKEAASVRGYIYMLDNNIINIQSENTYLYTNLDMNHEYKITVKLIDSHGNLKEKSTMVNTSDKTYIYKDGNEYTDITGGWTLVTAGGGTGSKEKDHLYLYSPVVLATHTTEYYKTAKTINTSKYKEMKAEITLTKYNNGNGGTEISYGLYNNTYSTSNSGHFLNASKKKVMDRQINEVKEFVLDIKNNTYNLYPFVYARAGGGSDNGGDTIAMKVHKVWFE